jgi:hypothetical protein
MSGLHETFLRQSFLSKGPPMFGSTMLLTVGHALVSGSAIHVDVEIWIDADADSAAVVKIGRVDVRKVTS